MSKINLIGTGLSGLVGSRFVELFSDRYFFSNLDLSTGINITKKPIVKKAIGQGKGDTFIHLAAFTDVNKAYEEKNKKSGLCYKVNVLGTRYVAQYCKLYSKFLIHISTDFVFNGKKKTVYNENDSPHPIEWYGKTKFLSEKEVQKAGGKYTIIRISFPFRSAYTGKLDLVRKMLSDLRAGSLPPMFADQIITPTFIDDIATALDVIIRKKPQGIYHVVGSSYISPYQLARKIALVFGYDPQSVKKGSLEKYLLRAKRPYQKYLALSNRKARNRLGIRMSTIDEALATMKKQIS